MLVLELIVIGLAITLEPVPLTAFLLVLASEGGVRKGGAFVGGWLVSLVVVVAITLVATGNSPPKPTTSPSLAALAVKIAIGVALLFVAFRTRRRMGRPKPPKKPPKWQTGIDRMSPLYAMGLAVFVQPWGLIAAGAATVVDARLASWMADLALVGFCLLATGTYLGVEIYAIARPQPTRVLLDRTRIWIDDHKDAIIVWVSLIVGLWLIGYDTYLAVS